MSCHDAGPRRTRNKGRAFGQRLRRVVLLLAPAVCAGTPTAADAQRAMGFFAGASFYDLSGVGTAVTLGTDRRQSVAGAMSFVVSLPLFVRFETSSFAGSTVTERTALALPELRLEVGARSGHVQPFRRRRRRPRYPAGRTASRRSHVTRGRRESISDELHARPHCAGDCSFDPSVERKYG